MLDDGSSREMGRVLITMGVNHVLDDIMNILGGAQ